MQLQELRQPESPVDLDMKNPALRVQGLNSMQKKLFIRRMAQRMKRGSTKEPHVVYGLPEGTYTLHEELAPYEDGYVSASDVTFDVLEDGSIAEVEMEDEYSKIDISKTDLTTGEEIPGATLRILDPDGKVLEEWVTDGKPHRVEKLPIGEELTLREISAPDGYIVAEGV